MSGFNFRTKTKYLHIDIKIIESKLSVGLSFNYYVQTLRGKFYSVEF